AEVVLQRAGVLEPADRDGVVAGVADQLLRHPAGLVLRRVEVAWAHPLLVDLVVLVGEVDVERLRHRPADDRLDLLRQRFELLVAGARRFPFADPRTRSRSRRGCGNAAPAG